MSIVLRCVLAAALASCAGRCQQGAGQAAGKPLHVGAHEGTRLWLCVGTAGSPARNADAVIDFGEEAEMGVVVLRDGIHYSDLGEVEIDGRAVDVRPMGELEGWRSVGWYKVESRESSYMNSDRVEGWWADIDYVESLDALGRQTVRAVDVAPARHRGIEWDGVAVGTMRYRVVLEMEDVLVATPGREAAGRGGVTDGVRMVSRRGGTGNAVVDEAMGLANLPYIWGSAHVRGASVPGSHQAEMRVGADCADLVVAAWRLAGRDVEYTAVLPMIREHSGPFGRAIAGEQGGVYRDGHGNVVVGEGGVQPGAAVLWRFGKGGRKGHAAILVEDAKPLGVLSTGDLVLHTMWDVPEIEEIADVLPGLVPVAVLNPVEG